MKLLCGIYGFPPYYLSPCSKWWGASVWWSYTSLLFHILFLLIPRLCLFHVDPFPCCWIQLDGPCRHDSSFRVFSLFSLITITSLSSILYSLLFLSYCITVFELVLFWTRPISLTFLPLNGEERQPVCKWFSNPCSVRLVLISFLVSYFYTELLAEPVYLLQIFAIVPTLAGWALEWLQVTSRLINQQLVTAVHN